MNHIIKTTTAASFAAIGSAFANPVAPVSMNEKPSPPVEHHAGDWCNSLKTFGLFHKDPDSKFIQEVKFHGRLHWQYANIDGDDVNGNSFDNDFTEFRRLRVGAQVKFLNNFTLRSTINIVDDRATNGGTEHLEYNNLDELHLTYSLKNVGNLDSLAFRYGRQKIDIGAEVAVSSKKIKTVERAAISNKVFRSRYTGIKVSASKGNWDGQLGFLSLDDNDELAGWSRGKAISLNSDWKLEHGKLKFDAIYNLDTDVDTNGSRRDELGVGFKWAASLAYETEIRNWNILVNAIYGDNGSEDFAGGTERDGSFYGLIVMPSTFIIEDKLEFVARYQYQGSSQDEGIRTNSRYFRAGDNTSSAGADLNGGRGDDHHSIYTGLNYFLCGYNSQVMVGVEYEDLDTPAGDADATTLWAAYRTYF